MSVIVVADGDNAKVAIELLAPCNNKTGETSKIVSGIKAGVFSVGRGLQHR